MSDEAAILIVDDEINILNSLRRSLRLFARDNGFDLLTASSPEEGEVILSRDTRIVLVVSDEKMPGMQGHELAAKIHMTRPGLPVIILSGHTSIQEIPGTDHLFACLMKPWDTEELKSTILNALGKSASA